MVNLSIFTEWMKILNYVLSVLKFYTQCFWNNIKVYNEKWSDVREKCLVKLINIQVII